MCVCVVCVAVNACVDFVAEKITGMKKVINSHTITSYTITDQDKLFKGYDYVMLGKVFEIE